VDAVEASGGPSRVVASRPAVLDAVRRRQTRDALSNWLRAAFVQRCPLHVWLACWVGSSGYEISVGLSRLLPRPAIRRVYAMLCVYSIPYVTSHMEIRPGLS
jgi:hypothetical protein